MSVLNPVFDNWEETGYEEIAGFSPTFYRQIREMDANFKFAGWTADLMKTKLEEFVDNQFAASMDEATLTRIEQWLYLHANTEYDLETRRRMLGAVLTGTGKMGRQKIIDIVKNYTGVIPTMSFDHELTIEADITDASTAGVNGMIKELHQKIPAHILFYIYLYVIFEIIVTEEFIWQGLKIKFPIYYWNDAQYLDGTWTLNGDYPLDDIHDNWVLPHGIMYSLDEVEELSDIDYSNSLWAILTRVKAETEEDAAVTPGHYFQCVAWDCKMLNGTYALDGTARLFHVFRADLIDSLGIISPVEEEEELSDAVLEVRVNLYYLDGEEQLNSNRLLNAYYSSETL